MNKKIAKEILETSSERSWTIQGFGKMSTNITANARLHIWDRALLNPRVPAVHSHSYDFKSFVVVGRVRNLKFFESPDGDSWNKVLVSSAGQLMSGFDVAPLLEHPMEVYSEGTQYEQPFGDVHLSFPDDGTVTLVEWDLTQAPKHMKVYWRGKAPWADAKARPATPDEVLAVSKNALDTWF